MTNEFFYYLIGFGIGVAAMSLIAFTITEKSYGTITKIENQDEYSCTPLTADYAYHVCILTDNETVCVKKLPDNEIELVYDPVNNRSGEKNITRCIDYYYDFRKVKKR